MLTIVRGRGESCTAQVEERAANLNKSLDLHPCEECASGLRPGESMIGGDDGEKTKEMH